MTELMTGLYGDFPKDIPFAATHVWPAQGAVHAGLTNVVNVVPDNWPMALHLAEGSVHTVQTQSAYMGYKVLRGMDKKRSLRPMPDEAIKYGVTRLIFICLPYFLCGIMDVATGMLRGIGSSIAPMFITVAGVCGFRILWIYTVFHMPKYHTLEILYSSYMISWSATFLIEFAVFWLMLRHMSRNQVARIT